MIYTPKTVEASGPPKETVRGIASDSSATRSTCCQCCVAPEIVWRDS